MFSENANTIDQIDFDISISNEFNPISKHGSASIDSTFIKKYNNTIESDASDLIPLAPTMSKLFHPIERSNSNNTSNELQTIPNNQINASAPPPIMTPVPMISNSNQHQNNNTASNNNITNDNSNDNNQSLPPSYFVSDSTNVLYGNNQISADPSDSSQIHLSQSVVLATDTVANRHEQAPTRMSARGVAGTGNESLIALEGMSANVAGSVLPGTAVEAATGEIFITMTHHKYFDSNGNPTTQYLTNPNHRFQPITLPTKFGTVALNYDHYEFPCIYPNCSKIFELTNDLYDHIREHHKDWEMKCPKPNCTKQFKCMASLVYHVRRHTTDRPYKCPLPNCVFDTAAKGNLKAHLYVF